MNKLTSKITRHWKPLLLFNLLLATLAVGKICFSEEIWKAKAQLILPNTSGSLDADLGTLGSLKSSDTSQNFSSTIDPLLTQESILYSKPVLRQVLNSDPEKDLFPSVSSYKKLFEVSFVEQSNAFEINAMANTPELAHQRTANWIKAYQNRLNQLRQADNQNRQQFQLNQRQIKQAQQNLTKAEQELAQFQQNSRLVNSEEQTKGMVQVINELTSLQEQAQAKAQASQKQVTAISTRLGLTPDQAIRSLSLSENKDYQFIRNKLIQIEATLNQLRANFTEQEPRIQTLLIEQKELQSRLQQYVDDTAQEIQIDSTVSSDTQGRANLIQQLVELESEAEAHQKEADQLKSQIEQMSSNLESIPVAQAQLFKLERQRDIAEGTYKGLMAQVQQVGINSFETYPNIPVIEPPEADSKPSSPNSQLILLGSVLASAIGSSALLLLLENSDPLLDAKDLQSFNFPIVVCIPKFKNSHLAPNLPPYVKVEFEKLASAIISQPRFQQATSTSRLLPPTEEFKSTNLVSINSQSQQSHRLLITSAAAGEGKTTTIIGLGEALVNLGFRVLIVDGDYHKTELSQRFNYNPEEPTNSDRPIQLQPNLDLLPTKPSETGKTVALISQGQFQQRLKSAELFGNYNYVLIDTPPVSLTSEAVLMTSMMLDILFVVRPGISKRNSVTTSLDALTHNKSRILGVVVNGVKKHTEQYAYRSSYLVASDTESRVGNAHLT
jgi:polysaccharide biosynthesis transport protein